MILTKLFEKEMQTQYGLKKKYIATGNQDGKIIQFDAWQGNWNSNWAVGMDIKFDNSQWKKREYNGKTYWSLSAPADAKYSGGGGGRQTASDPEEMRAIRSRIEVLEGFMNKYKPMLAELERQAGGARPSTGVSHEPAIPIINVDEEPPYAPDDLGGEETAPLTVNIDGKNEEVPF